MEVDKKKPCNDQQKNEVVVKIGGGGGIGAVILFGGALAAAALASAFAVRNKGRSSGEERRRIHRDSSAPEYSKQSGGEGVGNGRMHASSDVHNKHSSEEATEEVKLDNGTGFLVATRSQILDEKPGIVVNGYAAETAEQISSASPRAVSVGPVTIKEDSHSSDEKTAFELEKVAREEETKQDVTDESLKESNNAEQVCVEEEEVELEHKGDGVVEPMNHKEAVEVTETKLVEEEKIGEKRRDQDESEVMVEHNGVEGVDIDNIEAQKDANTGEKELEGVVVSDQVEAQKGVNVGADLEENGVEGCIRDIGEGVEEKCDEGAIEKTEDGTATVVSESHVEDEQIALQPVFQNPVIEHVVAKGDEKEGDVRTEVGEMIQQDGAIEGVGEEDRKENSNEGQMIKENNKENEEIASEVRKEDGADEEIAGILEASESKTSMPPVVCQLQDDEAEDDKNTAVEVDKGLIHHEDIEVKKQDGKNEDSGKLETNKNTCFVCQPKDDANNLETNRAEAAEGERVSSEVFEVKQEDGENKEVAEQLEMNEKDAQGDVAKEVEQGLINPETIEVEEEDRDNEECEEKTSVDFVVSQVEDAGSSETTDTGIAAAKDNEIVEVSEDCTKDYSDETDLSEEIEEGSTGESSLESNGAAVWPAESLAESTAKLNDQEVHGKTLEDKSAGLKESNSRTGFAKGAGTLEKLILIREAYVGNATTWKIIIAMLSVVSSLSCTWLFGLSPVKMGLIVSLAMVLWKIQGY